MLEAVVLQASQALQAQVPRAPLQALQEDFAQQILLEDLSLILGGWKALRWKFCSEVNGSMHCAPLMWRVQLSVLTDTCGGLDAFCVR